MNFLSFSDFKTEDKERDKRRDRDRSEDRFREKGDADLSDRRDKDFREEHRGDRGDRDRDTRREKDFRGERDHHHRRDRDYRDKRGDDKRGPPADGPPRADRDRDLRDRDRDLHGGRDRKDFRGKPHSHQHNHPPPFFRYFFLARQIVSFCNTAITAEITLIRMIEIICPVWLQNLLISARLVELVLNNTEKSS